MQLWFTTLRALVHKEMLIILRDPRTRAVLIVPPLVQLLVFSFAATLDVTHVRLALWNQDQGFWSQTLEERIAHASFIAAIDRVYNPRQLQDAIDQRQDLAALSIPADATRLHAQGRTVPLQILLDGRRANSAGILLADLSNIVGADSSSFDHGAHQRADAVALRFRYNPNLIYRWFIVPGVGGILVTFITMLLTALSIARERELGTFDQLLVAPCSPGQIIIAKVTPALIVGTLLGTIMIATGIIAFHIPFRGSLPVLLFSLFLYILSVVGIGLMISSVCSTQQQAMLGTFSFVVPSVLMSGFATPTENMPDILQWLSQAIPLRYYLIVVEGSFLKNLPGSVLWSLNIPLLLIAIITLGLATIFVRRRMQ